MLAAHREGQLGRTRQTLAGRAGERRRRPERPVAEGHREMEKKQGAQVTRDTMVRALLELQKKDP